ncbi:MAG: hypothetical protein ACT4PE_01310 [Candidatus Eiseniibacteriota bacterium]
MKRTVPLFITGIVGTLLIISYFVPHPPFDEVERKIPDFFNIIAAFAFILGGGNLLRIHLTRITSRGHEWTYSLVTVTGFVVMLLAGLLKITGVNGASVGMEGSVDLADSRLVYDWLYKAIFVPCQATMFSLLAFFVASASYRAFRAKTPEATLLLIAAFVVLVRATPVANLTAWIPAPFSDYFHIPNLSAWIMSVPNLAGQRTIQIGIALGIVSNSLRLILGVERSHLGGSD